MVSYIYHKDYIGKDMSMFKKNIVRDDIHSRIYMNPKIFKQAACWSTKLSSTSSHNGGVSDDVTIPFSNTIWL